MLRIPLIALLLSAVSITLAAPSAGAGDRPNVILMMADDLANEDLSCYGGTRIETPNIDRLAEEGIKLTSYYAGNPVCSPSRMALLSGSYPARLGWRWGVQGYGFERGTGMSPRVYTMAEAFRDGGYRTAMTGKWHIGNENMSPENQGFTSTYYIRMSNNQNRDMLRDGKLVQKNWDNALLSETFSEEAIRVINEESDKPFFLYVPWTAPHFPADPHPDWQGRSGNDKNGKYVDTVRELDYRVGKILDALEQSDKADNTIVIFTSDNGRQKGQEGADDAPPFSGKKWHSKEGGTRVPFLMRYPGERAFIETDAMVAAIDLFPTLASACGVELDIPDDAQVIDGLNLWPLLSTGPKTRASLRGELLYWHGKGQATAIRTNEWKLYFNAGDKGDPDVSGGPVLYNLRTDPKETTDLSAEHPDRVEQMLRHAKQRLTEIYDNQLPLGTAPGVERSQEPLSAEEVWGPWIE
ncbi:MAG: sulfatase-like hydrolase/transferase [Phycisphaeraceae bacterium]